MHINAVLAPMVRSARWALGLLLCGLPACGVGTSEPARVALPVYLVGLPPRPVVTDLGFTVRLTEFRVAVAELGFTVAGEEHASARSGLAGLLLATAWAHPGHQAGGEVTGELTGRFVLNPLGEPGRELGHATLLPGSYQGLNLTFRRATTEERLGPHDRLPGHTAVLAGTATDATGPLSFVAVLDEPEGAQVLGGAFGLEVTEESRDELGLAFTPEDPIRGTTLFDGIDFSGLELGPDGQAVITAAGSVHGTLASALAHHSFWSIDLH